MAIFSAPINVVRYDNGTLIKLTATAHEFISYDFDVVLKTGTFEPDEIIITAEYSGDVSYGRWEYSNNGGESYQPAESGKHGLTFTAAALTISAESNLFTLSNSQLVIRLVGSDEIHADTITILRTIDPLVVYEYSYTNIQQDREKIALIASDEQIQQFRDTYTMVDKMAAIEVKADTITQTVTANYATKSYADSKAGEAVTTAAADATAKAAAARTGAGSDTDAKLQSYSTTTEMQSQIQQTAASITQTVSQTYETKSDSATKLQTAKDYADTVSAAAEAGAKTFTDGRLQSYSTTTQMNSAINQKATEINLGVSQTYSTKLEAQGYATIAQEAAAEDAATKASNAQANAIATAAADATRKANAAQTAATTAGQTAAATAKSEAITTAAADATAKANAAQSAATTAAEGYTDTKLRSYSTTSQMTSAINQKANEITLAVSETYSTKAEAQGYATAAAEAAEGYTDDLLESYSTTLEMESAIQQSADGITQSVSQTYSTKTEAQTYASNAQAAAEATAEGYTDTQLQSYSTTSQMRSEISQTATSITSTVLQTVEDGYVGNDEIISKINQTAEAITIEAGKINLNGAITANQTFRITTAGSMEATGGAIAGWDITTNGFQKEYTVESGEETERYLIRIRAAGRGYDVIEFDEYDNGWKKIFGLDAYGYITSYIDDFGERVENFTSRIGNGSIALNDGSFGVTPLQLSYRGLNLYDSNGSRYITVGQEGVKISPSYTFSAGHIELTGDLSYIDFHRYSSLSDYTARIIENNSGVLTVYNQIVSASDERLKKDIELLPGSFTKLIDHLQPKTFRFRKGGGDLTAGLIAQEVLQAEKEAGIQESVLVRGSGEDIPDPTDPEKTMVDYYSVDYSALTTLLLAKVQEQEKRITELETMIKGLLKGRE